MSEGRAATRRELARILEPSAVAIVGASRDHAKRGYQTIAALRDWGYEGDVYPINPKYEGESILGLPVYARVSDVRGPVDLACIVTPAHIVADVIADCGRAGVAGALVIAAGFSEIGNDELEEELLAVAREHDVRVIGPNVNGLVNVHQGLDLLGRRDIPRGDLAVLSQSGNIASALLYEATHSGRGGLSFYISVGNESDVRFHEYLPFLATHEETAVATLYVEGMADGPAFLREAATFVREKPIAALKSGLSDVGKRSARSHTASIAGRADVVDDVYQQAGVVRVERADELLSVSVALADQPPADGPNVGILTDGGGHATHAADSLVEHGLAVPPLEPETQRRIRDRVPENAPNVENPVDVLTLEADVDLYYDCADAMLADPNVDALLLCGYFGGYGDSYGEDNVQAEVDVAEQLHDLPEIHDKPVVAQTMFAEMDSRGAEVLAESSIPVFESINRATRCLAALSTYGRHRRHADEKSDFVVPEPDPHPVVVEAVDAGRTTLAEHEARELLADYGAPVIPHGVAETRAEAVEAAASFDGPVAMKVLSPDILHKTEADGVRLDVSGPEVVGRAFEELVASAREHDPEADIQGVLVSPMVDGDVELVVGVTEDEEVGRVVMFGLGGVLVEVLEDVVFRGLPLTEFDAASMLDDLDAGAVLDGARGASGVDREAVIELLRTVSTVACENPAIAELDLNPVVATPGGVTVLDAAVTLTPP